MTREHVGFVDGKYVSLHEHGGVLAAPLGTQLPSPDNPVQQAATLLMRQKPLDGQELFAPDNTSELTLEEKIALVKEQLRLNHEEYTRLSDTLTELMDQMPAVPAQVKSVPDSTGDFTDPHGIEPITDTSVPTQPASE